MSGTRKALAKLEVEMERAPDYRSWREMARAHDALSGADEWKREKETPLYDWELVASRVGLLRKLRRQGDVPRLVFYLREEMHGNLGNMANPALYRPAKIGTKHIIEEYLDEVTATLEYLCDTDLPGLPRVEKLAFFKRAAQSFGRSALLVSGGATLGLFHVGVMKALWSERLLPTVMSGSSAGSIIAAIVGTHRDDALAAVFDPGYIRMEAWRDFGLDSFFEGRGLADIDRLKRAINRNVDTLTFGEARERTGRILNVAVSPSDPNQFARLLNYLSAPNVLVRSAVLASCAIPGLFPPVGLQAKNLNGNTVRYMPKSLWVDGSLKMDVPKERVARMHNVNHFIVSQTNPHVTPFMTERDPEGVLPFTWELAKSTARVNVEHVLDRLRKHCDKPLLNLVLDKVHAVATQSYSGDINIYPHHQAANIVKTFVDPKAKHVADFVADGERATWPLIERIRNTTRISRTFEACLERLKASPRTARRKGSRQAVNA